MIKYKLKKKNNNYCKKKMNLLNNYFIKTKTKTNIFRNPKKIQIFIFNKQFKVNQKINKIKRIKKYK